MKRLALALVLAACQADPAPAPAPPPAELFAPEGAAEGGVVFLRGHAAGARVVVDVVVRGAADVHGAAFRLSFDHTRLAYVESTSGSAFSARSVSITKEARPGELIAAWTEKGSSGFPAIDETVLGSLTFDVVADGDATLSFRAERSAVVDRRGAPLGLAWRGGTFSIARSAR